jgi:hypothetical protein
MDKIYHVREKSQSEGSARPVALNLDRLLDLLDRPIAFHRVFVELTGSVTAALMLSQALYWTRIKRRDDPGSGGWFYKTQAEWEEETGMGRSEQETARKRLRQTPFWQEQRRGIPAMLYFRIDLAELAEALLTQSPKTGKPRQNIVYVSAERSRPCWTNITHRIYTCWLSCFEGPLLCAVQPWGLVKVMFPKHGRVHSPPE